MLRAVYTYPVILAAALPAHAATVLSIRVDPIQDEAAAMGCTLREAINVANASSTGALGCNVEIVGEGVPRTYRIKLPAYTYAIAGAASENNNLSGDIDVVGSDVEIEGVDPSSSRIDGMLADRIFHVVGTGSILRLRNITLERGRSPDGSPTDGGGGAILNQGGTVVAEGVDFLDNGAGEDDHSGGAILNRAGKVEIRNCLFRRNFANLRGGAIHSGGSPIVGEDSLLIEHTRFEENSAWLGGALNISSDVAVAGISTSSFDLNQATGARFGTPRGGAINVERFGHALVDAGTVSFFKVSFTRNLSDGVGGAIAISRKTVNAANSSILNNSSRSHGGGIYSSESRTILNHVTVAHNMAGDENSGLGSGGGLYSSAVYFALRGTVVAGNVSADGSSNNCWGGFSSLSQNALQSNEGCSAAFPAGEPNVNSDYVGVLAIPLDLGYPARSESSTFLMPLAGSLAIDRISADACTFTSEGVNHLYTSEQPVTSDQVGAARDGVCDLGAIEYTPTIFLSDFENAGNVGGNVDGRKRRHPPLIAL